MSDVALVFDVHVFLGAISRKEESLVRAHDIMLVRYHKLFFNNDIKKRYSSRAYSYGMTSRVVLLALEDLKQKRILVQRKRKKVNIDGFTADDLTFLETACNGATYLLTRDSDFHDNKEKIRRKGCRFEAVFPDRYVERYEE